MTKERTYTKSGYEALLLEMKALEEAIEKNKKDISTARSFGDLSENSEYTEAKEEQRKLAYRKEELQDMIKNAVVVEESEADASAPSSRSTTPKEARRSSIISSAPTRPIPLPARSRISRRSVPALSASAPAKARPSSFRTAVR